MRKNLCIIVVAVLVLSASSRVFALPTYALLFKSTYPSSPLSSLSTTPGVAGNLCTVCHTPSGPPRNPFGNAFLSNGHVFNAALENLDSDGDNFTNITEINAGTFPGDPSSNPSTGTTGPAATGGFCFIATAAYGSYLDPHVMVLRTFRDKFLLTNFAGRAFVKLYYRYSPPAADFIGRHETLRTLIRWLLTPLVVSIEYPIIFLGIILAGVLGTTLYRHKTKPAYIPVDKFSVKR